VAHGSLTGCDLPKLLSIRAARTVANVSRKYETSYGDYVDVTIHMPQSLAKAFLLEQIISATNVQERGTIVRAQGGPDLVGGLVRAFLQTVRGLLSSFITSQSERTNKITINQWLVITSESAIVAKITREAYHTRIRTRRNSPIK
jgi:hypothetical protein